MLRIYHLLKTYMVLIYRLLKKHMILIHHLLTQVVKVNSLYRYDKAEISPTKFACECLDEFDNFMVRQENFNAYVGRQLKSNAYMIGHLSDYMSRVKGELKLISKHASMVTTQVEQVLKAQNDLLN